MNERRRRYIIVSIVGTLEDARDVRDDIQMCGRNSLNNFKEDVRIFGCNTCGCATLPEQSCEDEVCGHDCEECGCWDYTKEE